MNRTRSFVAILFVAAVIAGCSMCRNPYDYTGPVVSPGGACPHCSFNERAGSAIGAGEHATFAEPTVAPHEEISAAEQSAASPASRPSTTTRR